MPGWTISFSYLLASILFILAIRGLASPRTAKNGNLAGIAGMVIAVAATFGSPDVKEYLLILAVLIAGGIIAPLKSK